MTWRVSRTVTDVTLQFGCRAFVALVVDSSSSTTTTITMSSSEGENFELNVSGSDYESDDYAPKPKKAVSAIYSVVMMYDFMMDVCAGNQSRTEG